MRVLKVIFVASVAFFALSVPAFAKESEADSIVRDFENILPDEADFLSAEASDSTLFWRKYLLLSVKIRVKSYRFFS